MSVGSVLVNRDNRAPKKKKCPSSKIKINLIIIEIIKVKYKKFFI